jgi:sirohydrochlorin ferrochelatase
MRGTPRSLLVGGFFLAAAGPLSGQAAAHRVGTLVVAHGGDSTWNALVLAAANEAKAGGPVEVSFLMGPAAARTRFQDAVARLERQGVRAIAVVPLLVSSHSGHYDQIRHLTGDSVRLDERMRHHLHMAGIERPRATVPMRLATAMDGAPHVARVLVDRARALAGVAASQAVFIVGHGPNSAEDYAAWMANLRRIADSVKAWGGFRDVRVDLVRDDAPALVRAEAVRRVRELIEMQHRITGEPVIVVPVLVSRGAISRDKLPNDLRGLPIAYSGEPLLPHAEMARWIVDQARRAAPLP